MRLASGKDFSRSITSAPRANLGARLLTIINIAILHRVRANVSGLAELDQYTATAGVRCYPRKTASKARRNSERASLTSSAKSNTVSESVSGENLSHRLTAFMYRSSA
jgi:ribosomal protein L32